MFLFLMEIKFSFTSYLKREGFVAKLYFSLKDARGTLVPLECHISSSSLQRLLGSTYNVNPFSVVCNVMVTGQLLFSLYCYPNSYVDSCAIPTFFLSIKLFPSCRKPIGNPDMYLSLIHI